jgi:FkbM family methyltransferase
MRRAYASVGGETEIQDYDGSAWMKLDLSEHMQSQIYWYGYYSRDIIKLLNNLLRPSMVVVDVGANIGEIAVAAAHRVGQTGRVLAFEPMPLIADRLTEHAESNGLSQLQVFNHGLFDREDEAPLYVHSALVVDGTANRGLATLYPTDTRSKRTGAVALRPLDAVLREQDVERIDLMKIDAEGAEWSVLRGAQRALDRDYPDLVVELNEPTANAAGYCCRDMILWLEEMGYEFFSIGRLGKLYAMANVGKSMMQNVLCRHRSRGRRGPF